MQGAFFRMLLLVGLVAFIAVTAGAAAWAIGAVPEFDQAVWWAFLRLTDPGYLGDDVGTGKRIISTLVTVSGYVVFMGALIAIMTQWFHRTMAKIDAGTTPVSLEHHFIVLGWTSRTEAIVRELLVSEGRVQRFYERLGRRPSLRVVVLAEEEPVIVRAGLEDFLEEHWSASRVIVRRGTPLRSEHLERVDYLKAAAVIVPSNTTLNESANIDAATIKTLLSTSKALREHGSDGGAPLLVAELADDRKVSLAEGAYQGPVECLSTDRIIARTIAQNIRHKGLSQVYTEVLGHAFGNELYVREWYREPVEFAALIDAFDDATVIGYVEVDGDEEEIRLNPALDAIVSEGDRIILVGESFESTEPRLAQIDNPVIPVESPHKPHALRELRRILVLGWNERVALLFEEMDHYEHEKFEATSVSVTTAKERRREIRERVGKLETPVSMIEADFTSATELAEIDLESFDDIVLVASDWLDTIELSDARTLMGYLAVRERLANSTRRPDVLVELLDPDNQNLLDSESDVLVSTLLVSHMLTHLALRRELGLVFEQLFGPCGVDIFFVPVEHYEIGPGDYAFGELRRRVGTTGDLAIGVRRDGKVILDPHREETLYLAEGDDVVVLSGL